MYIYIYIYICFSVRRAKHAGPGAGGNPLWSAPPALARRITNNNNNNNNNNSNHNSHSNKTIHYDIM